MTAVGPVPPGNRPRNRRGQGDRLRAEIVAVATELIDQSADPDQLTLRAVAAKIGISTPSIYRHFPDIEHLKMAVAQRCFTEFGHARDRATDPITDPAAALLARCRAYCRFAVEHPGPYRFMFSHQVPRPTGGEPLAGTDAFRALTASILRCQHGGSAQAPDDPALLGAQVWAALHGLALLRINVPQFPWPASLDELVDQTVTRLVVLNT